MVKVKPEELPPEAKFKGYEEVVIQDILLKTDNVRFRNAASRGETYLAKLPRGYEGQFGPGVIPALYFGRGSSEPKILEFFANVGLQISKGELSNLLIENQEQIHAESDNVYESGLRSSSWQHTDETLTRRGRLLGRKRVAHHSNLTVRRCAPIQQTNPLDDAVLGA